MVCLISVIPSENMRPTIGKIQVNAERVDEH